MTGQHQKLEAMGRAFGQAAAQQTDVESCELILTGLQNLVSVDIVVLRYLGEVHEVFRPHANERETGNRSTREVAPRMGMTEERLSYSLVRLAGQGMASQSSVIGGEVYTITGSGLALYGALQKVGEQ
ncbi:hypothetical protein SAMN04488570_0308 [Nocardioides scoriae]|uniref:Winged helix DNA-binding domain-containing protein n=2 Tax=Nocardioides scoriae TaxID=642780 RepID=A0A1H1LR23_9ACTN|nr:hypothetical protein SAMN04488570_0308 [Nocardioides scoriae]